MTYTPRVSQRSGPVGGGWAGNKEPAAACWHGNCVAVGSPRVVVSSQLLLGWGKVQPPACEQLVLPQQAYEPTRQTGNSCCTARGHSRQSCGGQGSSTRGASCRCAGAWACRYRGPVLTRRDAVLLWVPSRPGWGRPLELVALAVQVALPESLHPTLAQLEWRRHQQGSHCSVVTCYGPFGLQCCNAVMKGCSASAASWRSSSKRRQACLARPPA